MNIFVLNTGRCGSVTFAKACTHFTNYSVGHESQSGCLGTERFVYPQNHIEVDNRLSWFLGHLASTYDESDTFYVHLRRDSEAVVDSFMRRWDSKFRASIINAFAHGLLIRENDWQSPREVCRFYVDTVVTNVNAFLQTRPSMTLWIEEASTQFPQFMTRIGALGNITHALDEFTQRHNSSDNAKRHQNNL